MTIVRLARKFPNRVPSYKGLYGTQVSLHYLMSITVRPETHIPFKKMRIRKLTHFQATLAIYGPASERIIFRASKCGYFLCKTWLGEVLDLFLIFDPSYNRISELHSHMAPLTWQSALRISVKCRSGKWVICQNGLPRFSAPARYLRNVYLRFNKHFAWFIHSFISIQPLEAGFAGTRAQSRDRYGSGTLHPGQVLGGSLPLLSLAFRRSHFRRQVPVRPQRRERS